MRLVSASYEQSRLEFFREQLAAANRRLDWSMKHNSDWYDHSEKGEVVSFYEWAVKMAEKVVGKPMTNADRIRAMSDKELARFLASVENRRSADGGGAQWCGRAHALKWLQQPAEEVAHD